MAYSRANLKSNGDKALKKSYLSSKWTLLTGISI
jgi:hypothetical protein